MLKNESSISAGQFDIAIDKLDNTLKKYITTIKPEGLYLVDIEYFN